MSPSVSVRLLLTQSDARLVALACDGHERAFEALVQRYRRPLLRYCRRLLLPDERAEDALQQALMQAWLALQRGVEVSDARSWLYRIVHNAALNTLRVSGYNYCTLSESLRGEDAPQADLDRRIAVREALAGLAALPQMQREALLRTAVEGTSHAQAAIDLGVTEAALRGLVYRARATLRAAVTAVTPPPLVAVAVSAGTRSTPFVESLAGAGASGGSAGLAGLLLKGGVVLMAAGTIATGAGVAHRHYRSTETHARPKSAGLRKTETTADDATQPADGHPAPVRAESGRRILGSTAQRGSWTRSVASDVREVPTREAPEHDVLPISAGLQPTRNTESIPTQRTFERGDGAGRLSSTEDQSAPDPQRDVSPAKADPPERSGGSVGWGQDHDSIPNEDFGSKATEGSADDQNDGDRNSPESPSERTEGAPYKAPEMKSDTSPGKSDSHGDEAERPNAER